MAFNKNDLTLQPPLTNIQKKNLPTLLMTQYSWGLWRWVPNKGNTKWTKVPVDIYGNETDVKNFTYSFQEVFKAYKSQKKRSKKRGYLFHGIGFTFHDNNMIGIDIDDCVKNGKPDKATRKHIKALGNTYNEISVSGEGIHIIGLGSSRVNGVDNKTVFHKNRFFTVSSDGSGELKEIGKRVNKRFPSKKGGKGTTGKSNTGTATVEELMKLVKDIRPDIDENDWFDVCKCIHNKSNGSEAGYRLFIAWSAGDYCPKEFRHKDFNEEACDDRWTRCNNNKDQKVGWPKLREIKDNFPVVVDSIDFTHFGKGIEVHELLTQKIHKQMLSPDLFPDGCGVVTGAKEIARFNKVEFDPIISTMMIVTLAAIAKRAVIIERVGLEHNPSLGLLIGAPSGARKSSMDEHVIAPIKKAEKEVIEAWRQNRFRVLADVHVLKGQIKELGKDLLGDPDNEEKKELYAELEQSLASTKTKMPKLIEGDSTEEKLSETMMDNHETIFIQSDEGRNILQNVIGRYDATSEGLFINGLTGDTYRRSRVKNEVDIVLHNPCLNLSLKVQMDKLIAFVGKNQMSESGLLARMFTKVIDVDIVEQMIVRRTDKPLDEGLLEPYNKLMDSLLYYEGKQIRVMLSKSGEKAYCILTETFSSYCKPGAPWDGHGDLTNKIVSSTVKIAFVMKLWSSPKVMKKISNSGMSLAVIDLDKADIDCAEAIAKIMMDQTLEVKDGLEINSEITGAKGLLDKLVYDAENNYIMKWNISDIRAKYSTSNREHLERWLGVLQENGLVRRDGFEYKLNAELEEDEE